MNRREKLLVTTIVAISGVVLLVSSTSWLLWRQSVLAEERQVISLATELGQRVEGIFVEAVDIMDRMNNLAVQPCSPEHLSAMNDAVIGKAHIKALGYSQAEQRLCGVGFVQQMELRPPRADLIYPSGVIAWWPSEFTRMGDVELFLLRYGEHDIAIDPRLFLIAEPMQQRNAAVWVENLQMATTPEGEALPGPQSLPIGLTVDRNQGRVVSRASLGTILPIDVVVMEPFGNFWARYWPTLAQTTLVGVLLAAAWVFGMYRYTRHQISLSSELRESLDNGDLQAVYQPIIDLSTGRCIGAEALARWMREDEPISPNLFIPIAIESGLLPRIKLEVLSRILEELGPWLRENPALHINLNLGAEDLVSDGLAKELEEALGAGSLQASSINLEITERSLADSDQVRNQVQQLRVVGHKIAIDDFGTGYSSLSYLESFEIDTLKIDKTFVDAIKKNAVTGNVIGHIIEMAKSLKVEIVAEGIESEYQADWLRSMGVQYGQGYLFSRPLSATDFLDFLDAQEGQQKIQG